MGRAPCCDKASVKRGPWSPEEDAALRSYVEKHGTGGNWIALPPKAGLKRCGKSCRLRWLNYLRPDIKHGNFTEEEDNIICTLYKTIGSRWSVIASHLRGRTDNDVKNYWNTKLKKKVMAGGQPSLPTNLSTTTAPSPSTPVTPLPPPPPPPPPFVPTIKTEAYSYDDFTTLQNHALSSGLAFTSGLPPLPPTGLVEQPDYSSNMNSYVVSPSEDISATSSSVTVENNSGYNSWPFHVANGEDAFSAELGFASFSDFLNGYDTLENVGEGVQYCASSLATLASMWAPATETKLPRLTFSSPKSLTRAEEDHYSGGIKDWQ